MTRLVAGVFVACAAMTAPAQDFPSRPVHIVCPFPAGGGVDIVARLLGNALAEEWKRPVIVENRAGAGGTLGAAAVAHSQPDGYTILVGGAGSLAIGPALLKDRPYDPLRDLMPVAMIGTTAMVLAVNPKLSVKTAPELIAYARANPGKVTYASAGSGSILHLAMEMFAAQADIKLLHVPYKGAAPALADVVNGSVEVMMGDVPLFKPQLEAQRVRGLAVTTLERNADLPELPTLAQSGLPGFEAVFWHALFVPAGTSAAVVERISTDVRRVLANPALHSRLRDNGLTVTPSSPAELAAFVAAESRKWAAAVKDSGASAQ
jgi:tripartite-type tricarboxylate transporter receptor subunit TctC